MDTAINNLKSYTIEDSVTAIDTGKDTAKDAKDMTVSGDSMEVSPVCEVPAESISEAIESRIAILIALSVQGSSLPLPLLVPVVRENILLAMRKLTARSEDVLAESVEVDTVNTESDSTATAPPAASAAATDVTPGDDNDVIIVDASTESTVQVAVAGTEGGEAAERETETPTTPTTPATPTTVESPSIQDLEFRSKVLPSLERLSDPVILAERVKSLALREPYGTCQTCHDK